MPNFLDWMEMIMAEPGLTQIEWDDGWATRKAIAADPKSILNRMPERFRDGSIWIERSDAMEYLYVYLGSCMFFFLFYYFWKLVMHLIKYKDFEERSEQDKVFFLIILTSQAHHSLVSCFGLYLIYNSCQNHLGFPIPSEQGGSFTASGEHWGWFKSLECYSEMNKGYVYNTLFSIGFMTVETLQIHFRIEKPTVLNQQTKWHHVLSTFGYAMSLFGGYGLPGISNASLLCEFSSVFLNYKDMFREYRDTPLGIANQLVFFVCFFVFRILLFPMLVYRCFATTHVFGKYVGWFRWTCMALTSIASFMVTSLQFFWFRILLKTLMKFIRGNKQQPTDEENQGQKTSVNNSNERDQERNQLIEEHQEAVDK